MIRVQAGPGTGKTFGIRRRVLRILHPDGLGCPSTDVLVCSFNRAIAEDLRAEISAELADYHLESPTVRTIHSIAVQFAATSPRFLLPHEVEAMICDVLAEHPGLAARYRRVAQALRALREHESGIHSHPDLTFAAQGWMARHHASMVGDTPREVERRLAQGDEPEHRYRHVIVDEFQDLTETEAKLVLGLRTPDAEFVALGDRKQSIYAFRGNAEKGLDALPDLVAPQEVLDLTMDECQRCSAEIVEVGNALMQLEGEPMVSSRQEPAEIHMLTFTSPQREAQGMARHIVDTYRRHRDEEPRPKHLVLVTRRKWGYDLRHEIAQYAPDVDAQTIFAEDILETWPAREAFIYLSILGNPEDAPALRSWVGYRTVEDGTGFNCPRRNAGCYVGLLGDGRAPLDVDRARQLAEGPASALSGTGRSTVHERLRRLRDLWDAEDHAATTPDIVRTVLDPDRWVTYGGDAGDLARADIESSGPRRSPSSVKTTPRPSRGWSTRFATASPRASPWARARRRTSGS